jgi:hypothetical protein
VPSLRELQRDFAAGVFGSGDAPAAQWVIGGGPGAARRLAIYRNNTLHNLLQALRDVYPVVEQLVGEDFFAAAARRFIVEQPSTSGDVQRFGAEFGDFLSGFAPAAGLPYLGDTARLEWLVHRAFHATDHGPLSLASLARFASEDYDRLGFELHPACGLIASTYPIDRIWAAHQGGPVDAAAIDLSHGPVWLLVRRPQFEVSVLPLSAGEFTWLSRLAAGQTLDAATLAAGDADPDFDLGAMLAQHVGVATLVEAGLRESSSA